MNPRLRGRLFDATLKFFHSPLLLYPLSALWYGAALFRFGVTGVLFAGIPYSLFFGFLACVFCFQDKHGVWHGPSGFLELLLVLGIALLGLVPGVNLTPAWLVTTRKRRLRIRRLKARATGRRHLARFRRANNRVVPSVRNMRVKDVQVDSR
jgi:hypothetical protein